MNTQLERIVQMEEYLDQAQSVLNTLEKALSDYENIQPQLQQLSSYMDSGQWLQDFQDDEAGHIPATLKRGVLSEDALYNLLCRHMQLRKVLGKDQL